MFSVIVMIAAVVERLFVIVHFSAVCNNRGPRILQHGRMVELGYVYALLCGHKGRD